MRYIRARARAKEDAIATMARVIGVGAPNWTVLEKLSAGRRACARVERPSRQDPPGRLLEEWRLLRGVSSARWVSSMPT